MKLQRLTLSFFSSASLLALAPPAFAQFELPADQVDVETLPAVLFPSGPTTLVMPASGILKYESITIASGAIVTVQTNASNTPLYLVSEGDLIIDGTLDVRGQAWSSGSTPGQGGPGAFPGGFGRLVASTSAPGPGTGLGPGGTANVAYHGTGTPPGYGSALLSPLLGGSGGAGRFTEGGGGGGGAILLASNTAIIIDGLVDARGGAATYYHGAGGAIRVVAPTVSGSGILNVAGAAGSQAGRIRIDTLDLGAASTLQATTAVFGSWMEVDPFAVAQPQLQILSVAIGSTTWNTTPGSPTSVVTGPQSATNLDVRVQYDNFPGPFTLEVKLTPSRNVNDPSVAAAPRSATAAIAFNPSPPPMSGCYTDSTGHGECTLSVQYFTDTPMDVAAYVRTF